MRMLRSKLNLSEGSSACQIALRCNYKGNTFLLSYLNTLSDGPAGVWTHDLPHSSPELYQLSQPVGGQFFFFLFKICYQLYGR